MPVREWIERMRAVHERADRAELERLRQMTQEERVAELQAVSRAALKTIEAMAPEVRARALAWRDPLPESSVAALKRLRDRARAKSRG